MVAAFVGPSSSPASAQSWTRLSWLSVSSGHESERLLESTSTPVAVPAEYYTGLQPGLMLTRRLGPRARLTMDAALSVERFYGEWNSLLAGGAGNVELARRVGDRWRLRVAANSEYFSDSVDPAFNRFRVAGEAGLGVVGRRGWIELTTGLQNRRFPNVHTVDQRGQALDFSELAGSIGVGGQLRPARWLELSALVNGQNTGARDPAYDNRAVRAQGSVRFLKLAPLRADATVVAQRRWYSGWTDTYDHQSAGLTCPLTAGVDVSLRYARVRYDNPFDDTDRSWRVSLVLTWWSVGYSAMAAPVVPPPASVPPLHAGDKRLFRFLAPGAHDVALVGDFNGWNPVVDPMAPSENGWWQVWVSLPSGSHQYAYWVDGAMMTPPESLVTVDDGFGGRNGVVHVEPSGL